MDLNVFAFSGILIFITNIFLALFVFIKGYRKNINLLWSLEALAVAIYGLGVFKVGLADNIDDARFWWRLMHIGVILIPVFYYNFTYYFINLKNRWELYLINLLGLFFLIANTTPYFINNMRWVFGQFYYDSPASFIYKLFVGFFLFILFFSHYKLWRAHKPLDD